MNASKDLSFLGDFSDDNLWPDDRIAALLIRLNSERVCFMASDDCSFGDLHPQNTRRIYHGNREFTSCDYHAVLYLYIEGAEDAKMIDTSSLKACLQGEIKERHERKETEARLERRFREYLRRHLAIRDNVDPKLVEDVHIDTRISKMTPERITAVKDLLRREHARPAVRLAASNGGVRI